MPSISERLGVTPYPTIMRQNPQTRSPLDRLEMVNRLAQNPSLIRSSGSSSSRPNLPTIEETIRQNQQAIQDAINEALSRYSPRQIPTFSPSYYMPQNTLNTINQVRSQQFSPSPQLRQVAQRQVSLLTNPQIEALRNQINAYKSLIPQTQQQITENYGQAQQQLQQNTTDIISQIIAQTQQRGGLRPGVYSETSRQVQQNVSPISNVLESQRQLDIEAILGQLQVQKDNAASLLNAIESNKENMEEMQYNALVDQAQQQFNEAQQRQLQFLMQLAGMEQSARSEAASLEQERVVNYNNMLQQMLNQRLQGIDVLRQQQDQALQQQYNSNLQAWLDYLTGPAAKTNADSYRLLMQNRANIEDTVGMEGFLQLRNYISNLPPNQGNQTSTNRMTNPRVTTTNIPPARTLGDQILRQAYLSTNTTPPSSPSVWSQIFQPVGPLSQLLSNLFNR